MVENCKIRKNIWLGILSLTGELFNCLTKTSSCCFAYNILYSVEGFIENSPCLGMIHMFSFLNYQNFQRLGFCPLPSFLLWVPTLSLQSPFITMMADFVSIFMTKDSRQTEDV